MRRSGRRPLSVVLFDEVEKKAHPDTFNIPMFQVLDDGRLSDNRGAADNFSDTVIVMTSNIGAPRISRRPRRGPSDEPLREEIQG
nr:AAA family ATPase [Deltaproteobacteria bacterium]